MENITDVKGGNCGVDTLKEPDTLTRTPVSKMTRAVNGKQEIKTVKDDECQAKTPKAIANPGDAQTPRRSARKSVRPPLDYEDIMLRSASKVIHTANAPDANDNQSEEMETHKWSAAEVGRHSAKVKRSRKSKRTTVMQIKEEIHVAADTVSKSPEQAIVSEVKMEDSNAVVAEPAGTKTNATEQVLDTNVKSKSQDIVESETQSAIQAVKLEVKSDNREIMEVEGVIAEQITNDKLNTIEKDGNTEIQILDSKNMEELGLCPLEVGEEMPSLIVLDDEGVEELPHSEDAALNTTYDAEGKNDEEVFDEDMPFLQVSPEKKPSIKVVLINDAEEASIILDTDQIDGAKRSRPYRLPTPFKTKVSKNFPNTSNVNKNEDIVDDGTTGTRRRSKSFSTMKEVKGKTVSFSSPIEVNHVNDIDKRWEDFDKTNVTMRRKRSISVDEIVAKPSRLPQPKVYPIVFTPSKLKTRTKLPNFAAMHQKQFDKMENLVDHLERKAERAKALTNSALKQKQTSETKPTVVEDRSAAQPRSLKKIDLSATTSKSQEQSQYRRVQTPTKGLTPSKIKANVSTRVPLVCENSFAARPAFNLSTSLARTFHAKPMPPSDGSNKVEERRQRHMDMFKKRTAKSTRGDFIRGVRLNRRFELQMQHRRCMEEED